MATFTLKLDDHTRQKLTEAARKADVTLECMAAGALEAWILADNGLDHSPAGVDEPAHALTDVTKDSGPDQHATSEDHEGPFVDLDEVVWPEGGEPREDNAANYDLNEVGRPWSEVRPEMEAYLQEKLAARRSEMTTCHPGRSEAESRDAQPD